MIHKYKLFGLNILLDVESGSIHIVDKLTFNLIDYIKLPLNGECPDSIIKHFKKSQHIFVRESYKRLYELYKNKSLFCKKNEQEYTKLIYDDGPIKAICLHIAHDCNLRCKYCFASTGDFGEGRKLMPFSIAKQSIDYLIENSGNRKNLEVDFFGGEPLLNYEVVEKTVKYARSLEGKSQKHFRFTMTTNGILLDDSKIEFLNKEMDNIVLSLDGRKKINDNMRPLKGNQGTHDIIVPKFKRVIKKRGDKDYYVRGTFTNQNLDFSKDLFHMYKNGFENLSIEPVVSPSEKDYAITYKDISKIRKEYYKLAKKIIKLKKKGSKINFFHYMIDLNQGPCLIKRIKGCGCASEYVAITPDGDIYPCHQFVGKKEWLLGNINEGKINKVKQQELSHISIFQKEECIKCWAKYYCSGGCNANNLEYGGSLLSPYDLGCELEKTRVECAIAIEAQLFNHK